MLPILGLAAWRPLRGRAPHLACAVDDGGATLLADGEPIAHLPGARAIDLDAVRLVAT